MKYAHQECFNFITQQCSELAMEHIGEDWEANEKCVDDSFESLGRKGNNTILYENTQKWVNLGTMYWPMVTINDMTFRGDITAENILEDICANLIEKPPVCIEFYKEANIEFAAKKPRNNVISAEMLIIIVTVLIAVNVILILAYRRCVKKEMEDNMGFKVSSAVSQYISLAQQDRSNTNNSLETN